VWTVADYSPVETGGAKPRTFTASAVITGGQVVIATGNDTVGPSGAASTAVVGVAAHDAANGAVVTVWPLPGVTHEITASAIVAAGGVLISAAAGQVAPVAAETGLALLGVCTRGAGAAAKCQFMGR
jgi:hypothetical protein